MQRRRQGKCSVLGSIQIFFYDWFIEKKGGCVPVIRPLTSNESCSVHYTLLMCCIEKKVQAAIVKGVFLLAGPRRPLNDGGSSSGASLVILGIPKWNAKRNYGDKSQNHRRGCGREHHERLRRPHGSGGVHLLHHTIHPCGEREDKTSFCKKPLQVRKRSIYFKYFF